MNLDTYNAVSKDPVGAGVGLRQRSWIRLSGRDRATFLNGQITNDVLFLHPGDGLHACLLNNTGHMLANLYVYATDEHLWIEVTRSRSQVVVDSLNRYLVREEVEIEDVSDQFETIMIQGEGSRAVICGVLSGELPPESAMPLSFTRVDLSGGTQGGLIQHPHTTSRVGFDLIVPAGQGERLTSEMLQAPGAQPLDWDTLQVLRIEAGIPKWGSELTEQTIPLEANLISTISQHKGCYMGQEVIARILARGHTNRGLVGYRLSAPAEPGTPLQADEGPLRNQDPGRITSVTDSPTAGLIALGYVRNEYSQLGMRLHSADGALEATITALPFVA